MGGPAQSSSRDPAPRACLRSPASWPHGPHRLLRVLEDLAGLLVGAGLLPALSLQASLLHLLQERVGPAGSLQDTVGLVPGQEHWVGGTRLSRARHVATHRLCEPAPAGAAHPVQSPAPSRRRLGLPLLGPPPLSPGLSSAPSSPSPRPELCSRWGAMTWFCTIYN